MTEPLVIDIRELTRNQIPGRTYLTHGFDKYPAKMIPHLARWIIDEYSVPGNSILDPFCGCGTVLIESLISERRAIGVDINPFAILLAQAKSGIYRRDELAEAILEVTERARILKEPSKTVPDWIRFWFTPATLRKLLCLRESIDEFEEKISSYYATALKAILGVAVRLSSKADPRSPKPFISRKARRERVGRHFDAFKIFVERGNCFAKFSEDLHLTAKECKCYGVKATLDDARRLLEMEGIGKFDAVISSPPYLSAQDYYRSSKLEICILGLTSPERLTDLGSEIIGSGRGHLDKDILKNSSRFPREIEVIKKRNYRAAQTIALYLKDIKCVLNGCYARLSKGGYCCLVVGDSKICGVSLPVHKWIIGMAEDADFGLTNHYIDFVKHRRVPPIRCGHESIIVHEHILVFQKQSKNESKHSGH